MTRGAATAVRARFPEVGWTRGSPEFQLVVAPSVLPSTNVEVPFWDPMVSTHLKVPSVPRSVNPIQPVNPRVVISVCSGPVFSTAKRPPRASASSLAFCHVYCPWTSAY